MIERTKDIYILHTDHTTYAFRVMETGHLEHLYYGRRIRLPLCPSEHDGLSLEGDTQRAAPMYTGAEALTEKYAFAPGNTNPYDEEHPAFSLENACLEMSAYGKGDIREPFIEVVHADGSFTSDFLFREAEISGGKEEMETLPGSYGVDGKQPERLKVTLRDASYDLLLELHYYVYGWCDVITRTARLVNEGKETVTIRRLLSAQLDFARSGLVLSTFSGAWAREMNRSDIPLSAGKTVNASYTGSSSSRANPFVMLSVPETTEDAGDAYGLNLIYSGNHYEAAETSAYGKTRIVWGINPQSFSWLLEPGQAFEAPEAILTYSHEGFNGMSRHLHDFLSEHVVRGYWKKRQRPILLNSWEAAYFQISESRLLRLAGAAKEAGIELFVMDDGWFAGRNDDTSSLGDWDPDPKKLPHGIDGICKKVNALGLDFGIWVEPEMISIKSRLYEAHPDWVLRVPGKPHTQGRHQCILDLTRTDVQDYIIEAMSRIFSSANIAYVKWDMNRTMTDVYSSQLPADRQGEVFHRYMLGLYRCLRRLTERFPKILFEGCAAGGNRFDPGMLCYFPQIWGSDDTDAVCRASIQTGYSYGYPPQAVSAHVSGVPNHQTLRRTPLSARFAVAAFGSLGYECNLTDLSAAERAEIKEQISLYKKWRDVFSQGSFYRGRSFFVNRGANGDIREGNVTEWTIVSPDQKRAAGMLLQKLALPNDPNQCFCPKGLSPDRIYHFYGQAQKHDIRAFGDLLNTISPVHIRQGSPTHNALARFVKLDEASEDFFVGGDALMYAGVKLRPGFSGTGYNEQVRLFPDFAARLYFMEAVRSAFFNDEIRDAKEGSGAECG